MLEVGPGLEALLIGNATIDVPEEHPSFDTSSVRLGPFACLIGLNAVRTLHLRLFNDI